MGGLAGYAVRLDFSVVAEEHGRADGAAVTFSSLEANLDPVIPGGCVVAQQGRRFVPVHDENVDVAVIVEVPKCAAPADKGLLDIGTNLAAVHVDEGPISLIPIQEPRISGLEFRTHAFQFRINGAVDHKNVGIAIIVEIRQPGSPADESTLGQEPGW